MLNLRHASYLKGRVFLFLDMKIWYCLLFSFFTCLLLAQDVNRYKLSEYDSLIKKGLTVVLWTENPKIQKRIQHAFKKHYHFSGVRFMTQARFNLDKPEKDQFYFIPLYNIQEETVTDLYLIQGRNFKKFSGGESSYSLNITLSQPFSEKGEVHYQPVLTEAYVILLNDLLNKTYLIAKKKIFWFRTYRNPLKLFKSLYQPTKMVHKTLIIPKEYLSVISKENWETYYKQPIKFIPLADIDNVVRDARSDQMVLIVRQQGNIASGCILDLGAREIIFYGPLFYKEKLVKALSRDIEEQKLFLTD